MVVFKNGDGGEILSGG